MIIMGVNIVTKNFTDIQSLNQLPFNTVGAKFSITAYHPNCGWCGKLIEESVNKQCDLMGKKNLPCFGINAGTQQGQKVMQEMGLKSAFPQSFFCNVTGKDDKGKPKVDCAVGEGWLPADVYSKALKARGFI